MLDHALEALDRGWPPIPLCWPTPDGTCGCGRRHVGRAAGKVPLPGRDYQHLRPTAADVRSWWRRWPSANVGVLLEPAGLLVVDLDGRAAVAEAERLGCPATYTVRRGTERMHLYYVRPADLPAGRTIHRGASRAIDILAAGLVVGAGSRHASGDTYTVVRDLPPATPPAWACDALRCRPTARTDAPALTVQLDADPEALARLRAVLPADVLAMLDRGAPEGQRSEAEWRVLRAAVQAGLSDAEIIAGCLAVPWIADMRPRMAGWLTDDLARARSAVEAAPARPRRHRPAAAPNPWAWAPSPLTRTTH